jgi:hypothetical protein
MMYHFRIDDVSVNTDEEKLRKIINYLRSSSRMRPEAAPIQNVQITLAVSPLVFNMAHYDGLEKERVFPRLLHVEADHRKFYGAEKLGIPAILNDRRKLSLLVASHGMVHVDHRLMSKKAQELSIVTSCSLIGADTFVPPFHKWNKKTVDVCRDHVIRLVRFEDEGYQHLAYKKFDAGHLSWYFHTHDFTYEQFLERFS